MFVTLLIGLEAPLIATQLLWINLITDSLPAIALGMDPGNPDVMKEKPRDAKENFFAGGAGLHVILGGILIGALTILFVIGIPAMQSVFHLQMLDLNGWIIAISMGLIPLLFNEVYKIFVRARLKR